MTSRDTEIERIVEIMFDAYQYEDRDNSIPVLPFVDDHEAFWRPFAVLLYDAGLRASQPAREPPTWERDYLQTEEARQQYGPPTSAPSLDVANSIECPLCGGAGYLVDQTELIDATLREGHQLRAIVPDVNVEDRIRFAIAHYDKPLDGDLSVRDVRALAAILAARLSQPADNEAAE
jgi:hypothetical protein